MSKQLVADFYAVLTSGDVASATSLLSEDVSWCAAHPINDLKGVSAFIDDYWSPISTAMPDVERRPFIILEGEYEGRTWVNSTGYLVGIFDQDLFDIPATGRSLFLRYGELMCVENGKITEAYVILDFISAMDQAGVNPLRPSLGCPDLVMPPMTMDGRAVEDDGTGDKTIKLVDDMIDGLLRYDGKSLQSMDQELYWHEDFVWYGPGGIGTTRGLEGFRAHHQGPFLRGFPDRGVGDTHCYFAVGNYAVTGGWPHMFATHTGEGWLGMPPTGARLYPRVFDFWRREGDKLRENWVSIDIIHMLKDMGLDVFDQMRQLTGRG